MVTPSAPTLSLCIPMYGHHAATLDMVQTIRFDHRIARRGLEVIVADNCPTHPVSKDFRRVLEKRYGHHIHAARYVEAGDVVGPNPAKERAIAAATAQVVVVADQTVKFAQGTLEGLVEFFAANPDTPDLFCGLAVHDNLSDSTTHLNDVFRGEGWGTAGRIWETSDGLRFSIIEGDDKLARPVAIGWGAAGLDLPGVAIGPYAGHGERLRAAGCREYIARGVEPVQIPGAYTGVFAFRRDSWLGFHPAMRGYGGGDMCLQWKYHRAGRSVWLLPRVRWHHRYPLAGEPRESPPPRLYDKVRNCLLMGAPRDRFRDHFVAPAGRLAVEEWDKITAEIDAEASGKPAPRPAPSGLPAVEPPRLSRPRSPVPGQLGDYLHAKFVAYGLEACLKCTKLMGELNLVGVRVAEAALEVYVDKLLENSRGFDWGEQLRAAAGRGMESPTAAVKATWAGLAAMFAGSNPLEATIRAGLRGLLREAIADCRAALDAARKPVEIVAG